MTAPIENKQKGISVTSFNESSEKLAEFRSCHDLAFSSWSPFLIEAAKDHRFCLGDQWSGSEKEQLAQQGRSALVFNRVRRNIKMVSGYERRTRHSLIAMPVENQDDATSSLLTSAMLWSSNYDNMSNTMSNAFEGALKTGINLLELSMDYSDDLINGEIRMNRIPYNAVLLDPRFTKRDLSDCEYILHRRMLSKSAAKKLLPFRADEIDKINAKGSDGQFSGMHQYAQGKDKGVLKYDEFWQRKTKQVKVLVDTDTGEVKEFDTTQVDKERVEMFAAQFPNIKVLNKTVGTVELTVFIENILMYTGEDPMGIRDFPHVPVMAFWDPEYSSNFSSFGGDSRGADSYNTFFSENHSGDFALKLQSLVRCSRDPQTEANKRRSKMLDIIDSQINTGWQAMENSVVNPGDMYQSGQGKVVWMKDGHPMTDAQKIQPPDIPQGLFNLSQMMDQDIVEVAGITDELLGMQDDGNLQMSGVLAKLRQGAGITVLQDLFDNFRLAQKVVGTKLLKIIQEKWQPQKIARITGEEPTQELMDSTFAKYDVVVEEALETPTQRALAYTQLLQAKQMGVDIPDDIIIDFMPLTDKKSLKDVMEQRERAAQEQQAKIAEQEAIALELANSQKVAHMAMASERKSRERSNLGLEISRISEAEENRSAAALNRAKTITEIAAMEDDRIMKVIGFVQQLEQSEIDDRNQIAENLEAKAQGITASIEQAEPSLTSQ